MAEKDNKMKMIVRSIDAAIEDDKDEIVSKYIRPIAGCICCNTPNLSIKINEAYLRGFSYPKIVDMFSSDVEKATGDRLTTQVLAEHFSVHFDSNGAAIAEFNRLKGQDHLPQTEKKELTNIFDAIVTKRVNDLEILDLSMKEQIKRLRELENIKEDRIANNRTFDLEHLIMKQETIMNNLQTQVLTKLKIWQKATFQSKQMELMDQHMQFLDSKTAGFLGLDVQQPMDSAMSKEAERVYLKVVIENILKIVSGVLDTVLQVDANQKAHYFKEFNNRCKGIEKKITDEFKEKLTNIREVK